MHKFTLKIFVIETLINTISSVKFKSDTSMGTVSSLLELRTKLKSVITNEHKQFIEMSKSKTEFTLDEIPSADIEFTLDELVLIESVCKSQQLAIDSRNIIMIKFIRDISDIIYEPIDVSNSINDFISVPKEDYSFIALLRYYPSSEMNSVEELVNISRYSKVIFTEGMFPIFMAETICNKDIEVDIDLYEAFHFLKLNISEEN